MNGEGEVTNKYVRGIKLLFAEDSKGINFYLFNGHGDVIQLSGIDGNVIKEHDYHAFGNEKNLDPNDTNVFRYCGEYFDRETGTIYLRARYYNPLIGRFTAEDSYWNPRNMIYGDNPVKIYESQDPLGLTIYTYAPDISAIIQRGNLYTYCSNNPGMYIDPAGFAKQWIELGKGWEYSIHPENPDVNKRHIHIRNNSKQFSQNDDGSPHDKKNSKDSPPKDVLKKVKEKTGWDWKSKEQDFLVRLQFGLMN